MAGQTFSGMSATPCVLNRLANNSLALVRLDNVSHKLSVADRQSTPYRVHKGGVDTKMQRILACMRLRQVHDA